ncbi:hypothetical protein C7974DRAFT_473911 [Boeremia exigua]|uniref:uncharacterized protein n=1 Tax=Boeremia exigua TaxID=749465 RepID=UPI001E8D9F8F|nr:uncharacterized protein C7974DRAFT_473911 [Boeremia exigua]KAH6620092.1 hypothetical protein C7974DRAFT_473911 [Boeremia exigua]
MALLFQATDYTPPSSPTHPPSPSKFSDSMTTPRLTRTPTSPTKPVSVSPAKPPSDPQSNITKALRTLHRTTSAFALRPQASAASLRVPGSPTGPREVVGRWPFSRSTTATSMAAGSEVGARFEGVLARAEGEGEGEGEGETVGETVVDGRRRGEARERVVRMRGWLMEPEGNAKGAVKGGERERVRLRVDSGTYEAVESSTSTNLPDTPGLSATTPPPTPPTPTATTTQTQKHHGNAHLPPLHEDTLFLSLHGPYSHTRTHTPRLCTCCNTPGAAWTLHGCGHGVHARCVEQLGSHSRVKRDGGCGRCEGLGRWVDGSGDVLVEDPAACFAAVWGGTCLDGGVLLDEGLTTPKTQS